jgi:PAS domain S-box-containing protein
MTANNNGRQGKLFLSLFWLIAGLGLYASSLYSYLLFHSLVELFSVLVAFLIFVLAWHTRRLLDNHYLLFIGIASLASGSLDLVHILAYKGMGVFPGHDANIATQLWIAFRYVFSSSLFLAAFFVTRRLHPEKTLAVSMTVTVILLASIFLRWFPDCFVEGSGLTLFKIASEYVICLIFLAALAALFVKRQAFDRAVLKLMALSILSSVLSELSFTQYASVYGAANMMGHFFELLSYTLIYRAIVVTGVVEPSNLLFRNLKQSEEALKESEAKYRSLFENMIDGFAYCRMLFDDHGRPVDFVYLAVNNAFEKLTGLKQVVGKNVTEVIPGIRESNPELFEIYGKAALTGKAERFELYLGPLHSWLSISVYSTERGYFVAVFDNITARKQTEEELRRSHEELEKRVQERTAELVKANEELETEIAEHKKSEENISRLNRLYSVLSKVNEAIFRTHNPEKLYERVCRIAVEDGQFKMAWIGLTDSDTRMVKPVASYGDGGGYLDDINICAAAETAEGRGPTGTAVCENTYSICDDIEHDPRMLPWCGKALRHGFRSSAAFPLRAGSTVVGAFTIYSSKPQSFTGEEIVLLNSLAEDLSLAIDSMNNEKMRLDAEEALRGSSEELSVLYNNSRVTNDLLLLFPRKFSRKEYLDAAVLLIREWSSCRHAGMRIADDDGNIPYESCAGYSSQFLKSEGSLSLKHDHCVCTRVTAERLESHERSAATPNGSFYSNDTSKFVGGLTEAERARYRGVCMKHGFLSLAVVPIRYRDKVIGAVHLADEHEGMVPLRSVEFIEQLALIVGEAVFRFGVEDQVRKLNQDLEHRVAERTAQLEAANKELEAFAYSVSHDLRAPLRAIDGFSRVIEEEHAEKLSAAGRDHFRRVRAAGQKMGHLIDAMLKLSRLTRGELNRIRLDLGPLAKAAAHELKKDEPDRRVTFDIAEGMIVEGDPVMLRMVVENLLGNAWKFTGKRETVRIEFGIAAKDGKDTYFVRDNGAGFDMTYAKKLFMAFQRLHTTEEFPGLGIGLATVQRIIHRHGGRIWAEGEPDKGATFFFTLG